MGLPQIIILALIAFLATSGLLKGHRDGISVAGNVIGEAVIWCPVVWLLQAGGFFS